ncbi:maltotransferase domain-containing protein [Bifidobacterium aemilianum]|uniref:maltotransferase domain-containing protein n=1 Tax=Bifidobacterium aemilianum TaxID=2493120 RepID=UPI0038B40ABD
MVEATKDSDHTSAPGPRPQEFGRVAILGLRPNHEGGIFPARVELGEVFRVSAQVLMEGRPQVGATAVLYDPAGGRSQTIPMTCTSPGLDLWEARLQAGQHSEIRPWEVGFASRVMPQLGQWTVQIEGWEDNYLTWLHDARIKVEVGDDLENALRSGAELCERWVAQGQATQAQSTSTNPLTQAEVTLLKSAICTLSDGSLAPQARLEGADNPLIRQLHQSKPLREGLSLSRPLAFKVERPKSSFVSWYQFFPRSEGAQRNPTSGRIVPGTLRSSISGLERAAAEGFDMVYLPPIFPIGISHRKGKDNSLTAGPEDPGSPFAIGSQLGGHDTVDPALGTMEDFKVLCAKAHELGLEIALDFALQCSPDHPWVREHPNWFHHKPDGSIAFAENPPKKYQDIYPIDFEADMPGIEREVERILELWIEAGVTAFRVDNPHTKPVRFWQEVIAHTQSRHPEVLFLAEAFTRPALVRALSLAGFTQTHCYFPWRNSKAELEEYLVTTNSDEAYYQHNSFWPTTPDILTAYLRDNGVAGHAVRAVLAALGSPSWGIYNGYELIENQQKAGSEEQADNEKYEIKVRDWGQTGRYGIADLLTSLNTIRREHPACGSYHNLSILESDDPNILAFARHTPAELTPSGRADTLIVLVNLDGRQAHQATVNLEAAGLPGEGPFALRDELTGQVQEWEARQAVSLDPWSRVAWVLSVVHESDGPAAR